MHLSSAAVTVRTYWVWETTATLRLLGGARGAGAPSGEERGGDISCRHAHSLFTYLISLVRTAQLFLEQYIIQAQLHRKASCVTTK